jgi:hypothetical protein
VLLKLAALTVQQVLYLLHVDLQKAALDVELNRRVCLVNHLKEVVEHPGQQAFEVLVVEVGSLRR